MSCYIYTDYCLVLHLQMKIKYFQQHKWSKAWIDTAKEIVKDKLAKYKVPHEVVAAPNVCRYCLYYYSLTNQPYTD